MGGLKWFEEKWIVIQPVHFNIDKIWVGHNMGGVKYTLNPFEGHQLSNKSCVSEKMS